MTKFRTKGNGEGRKVYPITKKQPYGITREMAYKDVVEMRRKGDKARLIKTNQRLDLYAPYESVLPNYETAVGSHPPSEAGQPGQRHEKKKPEETRNAGPKLTAEALGERELSNGDLEVPRVLAVVNEKGNLNMDKSVIKKFFSKDASTYIENKDGETTYFVTDASRIAVLEEKFSSTLKAPYGEVVAYGEDLTIAPESSPSGKRLKINFDYEQDGWKIRLEGDDLKKLNEELNKRKDEDRITVLLRKRDGKSTVEFCSREFDDESSKDRPSKDAFFVASGTSTSNKDQDTYVSLPPDYVRDTLQAMLGKKAYRNPGASVVIFDLKPDYPLTLSTRRIVGENHVEIKGYVAPRVE